MITFNRSIAEVSREELIAAFDGKISWDKGGAAISGFADVTRAIIMNEVDYPSDTAERDLRDIWYGSVKPVFDKLGFLIKPQKSIVNDQSFMKGRTDDLSNYLVKFVEAGLLTYLKLGIVDHSRPRSIASDITMNYDSLAYRAAFGLYPNLVLATEKDTQFRELSRIADLYGCCAISGSGQNAFGATEQLLRQIKDDIGDDPIIFLTFTDYDGDGYNIARTFEEQMWYCLNNEGMDNEIESHRLGLVLGQLSNEEIEANKFLLKDNAINKKWVESGHGVNGEFYGVELNAIKHARRIDIITNGLSEFVDIERYREQIPKEYIKKVILAAVVKKADPVINQIVKEMPELEAREFDMQELAREGATILPILCKAEQGGWRALENKISKRAMALLAWIPMLVF